MAKVNDSKPKDCGTPVSPHDLTYQAEEFYDSDDYDDDFSIWSYDIGKFIYLGLRNLIRSVYDVRMRHATLSSNP